MKYIIWIFIGVSIISVTKIDTVYAACSPTCTSGQVCVKKADGSSVCARTTTGCNENGQTSCSSGKTCVAYPDAEDKICLETDTGNTPPPNNGGQENNPTSSTPLQDGLSSFGGENSGLRTSGTLIGYIAQIIRWILGLLGMVFFVIIVLQGYLYMTAGGDTSKTSTATQAITNAVIGLMIIMGAFIITNFVTSALV